jgi:hypothetical protein
MSAAGWNHRYFVYTMFFVLTILAVIALSWNSLQSLVLVQVGIVLSAIANNQIWWFVTFTIAFLVVLFISRMIVRSSAIDIPKKIDTHLRLQFYGNAATPSHLGTRNIWRWYASCNIFVVNDNLPDGTQNSTELRSWNIVAIFDKPITLQQVRIDGNGVYLPRVEVKDRGERYIFVVIPGDIGNAIVDFHISSL